MSDIEAIRERHEFQDIPRMPFYREEGIQAHKDRATLLSLLTAAEARAEAAEARVGELEEAAEKAIKHADRRGMGDWPIFKNLAHTLKGTHDGR